MAPNNLHESCYVQGCQITSFFFACCCSLAFYPALSWWSTKAFLRSHRKNTFENKELILKYKAAVVGLCSICFSMSFLYLEATYLQRSSTAGKSLSNPFPSALTSQRQLTGGHTLLSPSNSPLHLCSPTPPLRHAATCLTYAAQPGISNAGVLPTAQLSSRTWACRPPTLMQRAAFFFFWVTWRSVCTLHGICRRNHAMKSGELLKRVIWCTALTCTVRLCCVPRPCFWAGAHSQKIVRVKNATASIFH